MKTILLSLLVLFFVISNAFSQFLNPQVDSIPMRDSKKLAADVYLPGGGSIARPTILIQTPYNRLYYRYGLPLGIGIQINQCNYNIVIVDWRGSFGSSGAAIAQPNRGEDGYDVVEWIATQSWSDGKVGTWGPSALGRVQYLTAKENPPHLYCIVPVVASPYYKYSEYYPGGVLRTEYVQQLDLLGFGLGLIVYPNPFYNVLWQYSEVTSSYPQLINVPCFMVGGWYDHNINEMIDFFASIKSNSPVAVRAKHKLLVGPWAHGGHSTAYVGSAQQGELSYPLAQGRSDTLAMLFFDFYLRDQPNNWENNSNVTYYNMGEHTWNQSNAWPPSSLQEINYYLTDVDHLSLVMPVTSNTYNFSYNPSDPSPTHGGATLRNDLLQGPYDQSQIVESRSDALVFTNDVFNEALYMYGKPRVKLYIQTDRKDTDFAVRLCDVYPDERSMLLSDGIKRCRFINGYTTADTASLVTGQIYELEIELPHIAQVFMPGHKLRLTITGSNYPRYDNNLNNGGAMYTSGDTLIANNVIHSAQSNFSRITFSGFIISATESTDANGYNKIFPNPAKDIIKIEGISKETEWIITDLSGRIISFVKPNEDNTINISFLSQGMYFLRNNNDSRSYKLVKSND